MEAQHAFASRGKFSSKKGVLAIAQLQMGRIGGLTEKAHLPFTYRSTLINKAVVVSQLNCWLENPQRTSSVVTVDTMATVS